VKRTIKQVIVTLGVAAVVSPVLVAVPAVAAAESGPSGPSGAIVVDPSFDPANAVRVDDRGEPIGRANQCRDRAFAAIPTMLTSVPGCSIIGSSKNTKITYSWYRDRGRSVFASGVRDSTPERRPRGLRRGAERADAAWSSTGATWLLPSRSAA